MVYSWGLTREVGQIRECVSETLQLSQVRMKGVNILTKNLSRDTPEVSKIEYYFYMAGRDYDDLEWRSKWRKPVNEENSHQPRIVSVDKVYWRVWWWCTELPQWLFFLLPEPKRSPLPYLPTCCGMWSIRVCSSFWFCVSVRIHFNKSWKGSTQIYTHIRIIKLQFSWTSVLLRASQPYRS